jgi:hypothetical protein
MVRASWVALFGALAIAGAAQAQVVKVTSSADSYANTSPFTDFGPGQGETANGAYNSFVSVSKNAVTFESANAVTGPYAFSSTSSVDLTIKNTGPSTITPQVHSQITPAGLGFYLADTNYCSSGFGECAQSTNYSFDDLNLGTSQPVTLASFNFSITQGDGTLYRAQGAVGLMYNSFGEVTTWQTFNRTAFKLQDFGVEVGNGSAFGYNWNATDVDFSLPSPLSPGQSSTISYNTFVQSSSPGLCIEDTTVCIVAYSGFGDPIGRGGGIDSLALIQSFDFTPGIDGLQFDSFTMYTDNYSDGLLDTTVPGTGGVPEPATWVSMILGFGLLGAALRRRKGMAIA